jgi:excisionase family DNA binding protein
MPHAARPSPLADGTQTRDAGEFLTDQQLAELLGVATRTTLRWRRDGGGPPYVRVGVRRVLYRRAHVDAWAATRTFPTLAAEAQRHEAAR